MKKVIVIMALLGIMTSCHKESLKEPQICFEMDIPSTKATSTSFESGDNVSVWAVEYMSEEVPELQIGGNFLNNEKLTYDGTSWKGGRTIYWSDKACDFYAVYPYIKPTSVETHIFEIAADQNSSETEDALGGYEASDILYAKATAVEREDGKVTLRFHHVMSKCVVNVLKGPKFEGSFPEDIAVHIYNTVTTADLNLTNGSVEKYPDGSRNTITMKKISPERFEAIVVPQRIERHTPLIEVSMGGIAYLLEYSLTFKPGYLHIINLTLNTSPDQEKFEISLDVSTDDMN